MPEPTVRWLLLLGSSRADDARLREAIRRLGAYGTARLRTAITRFPADDGSALVYWNALAEWTPTGAAAPDVRTVIREVEHALGRDRSRSDEVAIDIDLLARHVHGTWRAHPHALAKREFARGFVQELLAQAGIAVAQGAGPTSGVE